MVLRTARQMHLEVCSGENSRRERGEKWQTSASAWKMAVAAYAVSDAAVVVASLWKGSFHTVGAHVKWPAGNFEGVIRRMK